MILASLLHVGRRSDFHDLWRDDEEVWADTQYQTEFLTREATAFLKIQRTEQPFFLYLAYGAPHYPMMAPKKYLNRFPASMDRDRRMHAAMVAALDDAVGGITGPSASPCLTASTLTGTSPR